MAPGGTKLGLTTLPSNTSHAHLALHFNSLSVASLALISGVKAEVRVPRDKSVPQLLCSLVRSAANFSTNDLQRAPKPSSSLRFLGYGKRMYSEGAHVRITDFETQWLWMGRVLWAFAEVLKRVLATSWEDEEIFFLGGAWPTTHHHLIGESAQKQRCNWPGPRVNTWVGRRGLFEVEEVSCCVV